MNAPNNCSGVPKGKRADKFVRKFRVFSVYNKQPTDNRSISTTVPTSYARNAGIADDQHDVERRFARRRISEAFNAS